jgi:hypothetical protein
MAVMAEWDDTREMMRRYDDYMEYWNMYVINMEMRSMPESGDEGKSMKYHINQDGGGHGN